MISVTQARALALEHVAVMATEQAALADALGRTLAAPVAASRAQPPFAASAMDGYAVRSADTPGTLKVVGEGAAGRMPAQALAAGEAMRTFTGAPLPTGADCIVMQEDAIRCGGQIEAPLTAPQRHVRAAGLDFAAGAVLLDAGCVLDGPKLALAAAAGEAALLVVRRPRIAVLCGGDEVVPPGAAPAPAQIFDSTSYGIAGLAASWGALAEPGVLLGDAPAAIAVAIEAALQRADLVVMIGGASVGEHDHARAAAASIGTTLLFERVGVRPGKPTWFAVRDGRAVLGLPGNPASALVCACLFLRPLIARMLGRDAALATATQGARLRNALPANGARETYLRAKLEFDQAGQTWVRDFSNQDSSLITVFASADCLIARAPNDSAKSAGDVVAVLPL